MDAQDKRGKSAIFEEPSAESFTGGTLNVSGIIIHNTGSSLRAEICLKSCDMTRTLIDSQANSEPLPPFKK